MKWFVAVMTSLLAAGVARADGANPFLLIDTARVAYRIESPEPHPSAVLFLYEMTYSPGNPVTVTRVELAPDRPVILEPTSGRYQLLVLVPRSCMDKFGSDLDAAVAGIGGKIAGASTLQIRTREVVPAWSRSEPMSTVTYQIRWNPSGDSFEFHRTSPDPMRQWYVAAGLFTLGVFSGGVWLARRLVRSRAASRPSSA